MGRIAEWFGFGSAVTDSTAIASPWSDPQHLEQVTLNHLLDQPDNVPINRTAAMSIPAVARARHVLASTVAALPLVVRRDATTPGDAPSTQPGHWLGRQPEAGRPVFQTLVWTVDSLIFDGTAWWAVTERDAVSDGGRPRRVEFAPPWSINRDNYGNPIALRGRPVAARDWIRIDAHHEGLLTYGRRTLRAAIDVEAAAARAAMNPVPSIELHQTTPQQLSDEEIRKLVADWAAARRGKNGGVAYTNAAIEARTHGQAAEQLLISARSAAALDVARAMGVPAWTVEASAPGSSLTYSNTPSRSRELVDYGLRPYLAAIEARLSMDDILPRGTWCTFDTHTLLQGDLLARAQAAKAAQEAGILTREECRALELGGNLETGTSA